MSKNEANEIKDTKAVDAVVDNQISPEIQVILDEVQEELNLESKSALKKTIRDRIKKIRQLKAELAREEATLNALVSMGPEEIAVFNGKMLTGMKGITTNDWQKVNHTEVREIANFLNGQPRWT